MLFAQADITGLIGYILAGFATLGGVVALLYRELKAKNEEISKEQKAEIADLKSKVKSLESIANEGRETALQIANWYREKYEGKPRIVPLVPVLPESNSPSSEKQRTEARIATLRAGMAEIRKATGLDPRPTPDEAFVGTVEQPSRELKSLQEALGVKEAINNISETLPEATAVKVVEKLAECPKNANEGK